MVIISGSLVSVPREIGMGIGNDVESISTSITANWSWYNKHLGLVSWNFRNNSAFQETAVLYRSGYYFGNAYFPIYLANGVSTWGTQLSPLVNSGIDRNTMPLGIVDFGSGNRIIAFLFTLDPGESWSVLEGGFSTTSPPSNGVVFGVMFEKSGTFCVGYDPKQVTDYDRQTTSTLKGYSPNPSNVNTVEVAISSFAQFIKLFPGDTISDNRCAGEKEVVVDNDSSVAPGDIEEIVGKVISRIRSF
ncbi:MAG: hypothetical protein QXU18_13190 [Thermoplasmatales archaeon]